MMKRLVSKAVVSLLPVVVPWEDWGLSPTSHQDQLSNASKFDEKMSGLG